MIHISLQPDRCKPWIYHSFSNNSFDQETNILKILIPVNIWLTSKIEKLENEMMISSLPPVAVQLTVPGNKHQFSTSSSSTTNSPR